MTHSPTDTAGLVEELREHVRYHYMPAAARLAMERAAQALTSKDEEIKRLKAMNANLVATQGEELARIGVARECEQQAALSQAGEIERLRGALTEINHGYGVNHTSKWVRNLARAALSPPLGGGQS